MSQSLYEVIADGLLIHVRLTPKSAHDRIDGVEERDDGWVIRARVRAVPEDGKANKALLKLLSKSLSYPVGKLSLVAGHKSRIKRILVSGNGRDLARQFNKFLEQN